MNQRVSDDSSTELSKPSLQQSPNLENGQLKHLRFHLVVGVLALYRMYWLLKWIFSQSLNDLDNFLNWLDHNPFCIVAEDYKGSGKNEARKNCSAQLEDSFHSLTISLIDSSVGN